MNLTDFFDQIELCEELEGVAVNVVDKLEDCYIVVKETGTSNFIRFTDLEEIHKHNWHTLKAVALNQLPAMQLYHVSRVVGYFSRIENWNKSKLGELEDRRKGVKQYAAIPVDADFGKKKGVTKPQHHSDTEDPLP